MDLNDDGKFIPNGKENLLEFVDLNKNGNGVWDEGLMTVIQMGFLNPWKNCLTKMENLMMD